MSDKERLERFETMKAAVEAQHAGLVAKMDELRSQGKQKTVTYRQLMGNKLGLENILQLYKLYDID